MTPKEKAIELIEKYCQVLFGNEQLVSITNPKKCALIAVEEILEVVGTDLYFKNTKWFWQEVKEAIKNL